MESVTLTADQIAMIAQAFAIYGFIGVLGALFFYDLVCAVVGRVLRRFGSTNGKAPQG
ncbi:hypothetical protein AB4369_13860 [Vibrio sp. 10N.261.49.A5]|uniref:hypothetical protein n=1 Tax=Vibrio TaxID=662 RepID=UPI000319664C|nr:hypothetical protein [Vibrio tasmaniensis]